MGSSKSRSDDAIPAQEPVFTSIATETVPEPAPVTAHAQPVVPDETDKPKSAAVSGMTAEELTASIADARKVGADNIRGPDTAGDHPQALTLFATGLDHSVSVTVSTASSVKRLHEEIKTKAQLPDDTALWSRIGAKTLGPGTVGDYNVSDGTTVHCNVSILGGNPKGTNGVSFPVKAAQLSAQSNATLPTKALSTSILKHECVSPGVWCAGLCTEDGCAVKDKWTFHSFGMGEKAEGETEIGIISINKVETTAKCKECGQLFLPSRWGFSSCRFQFHGVYWDRSGNKPKPVTLNPTVWQIVSDGQFYELEGDCIHYNVLDAHIRTN